MAVINPLILLGIGILFIALESVITSFVIIWFGIGFLITGLISYIYPFSNGLWQLAVASIISLSSLILLRKLTIERFNSEEEIIEDFFNQPGFGVVKGDQVLYKATYWNFHSDENFEEDEKVRVIEAKNGEVKIEKVKK